MFHSKEKFKIFLTTVGVEFKKCYERYRTKDENLDQVRHNVLGSSLFLPPKLPIITDNSLCLFSMSFCETLRLNHFRSWPGKVKEENQSCYLKNRFMSPYVTKAASTF